MVACKYPSEIIVSASTTHPNLQLAFLDDKFDKILDRIFHLKLKLTIPTINQHKQNVLLQTNSFSENKNPKLDLHFLTCFHEMKITSIDAAQTERIPYFLGTSASSPFNSVDTILKIPSLLSFSI